jgi:hypothetical protein
VISGIATVTPNDSSGGGTFTPTSVAISTASPSATFTYTPASSGAKTIGVTNNIGLTNPASLTYTGIAALIHHLLNTLISYWTMDETSIGAVNTPRVDSHGTNVLDDPTGGCLSATGKINNGVLISAASSQYLAHASNASLQVTSDFTFSVWVKITDATLTAQQVIISKSAGTINIDYELMYDATNGFRMFAAAYAAPAGSGAAATSGAWYHLVAWFDSATSKVYLRINDATTYTGSATLTLIQSGTAFQIGARPYGGGPAYFTGVIDEVGFWKRKLTSDEISKLYNGGAGFPYGSFTA